MKATSTSIFITLIIIHAAVSSMNGQSAFTYQGRLQDAGTNASGLYDFQFSLHSGQSGGSQIGSAITRNSVPTTNGLFTVSLDFGAGAFDGSGRWLEIVVKPAGAAESHTLLTPRQLVTPAPEAIFAQAAATVAASSVTSTQLAPAAVTGTKIANGQVVRSINFLTDNIGIVPGEGLTLNTVGNTLQLGLAPASCLTYSNCYWNLLGNGNITPGVNFLGTVAGESDPLEFRVNNATAMRYEPSSSTPNIIGGYGGNSVAAGVIGANIGGGGESEQTNFIASEFGTIGGGRGNKILDRSANATIGGGIDNTIGEYSSETCTIAGGSMNAIAGDWNTISGGRSNIMTTGIGTPSYSSINGGGGNRMHGSYFAAIVAGRNNYLGTSAFSVIGGGDENRINSEGALGTISGGRRNVIDAYAQGCAIGGGEENRAWVNSAWSVIGGGRNNTTYRPYATIPGGVDNEASESAFAAGTRAKAVHFGAFVWGDSTSADLRSTNENSVTMRAGGGYRLFSDPGATVGADLASGSGSWTIMSDRNAKENFEDVTPREVLEKVAALPVQRWNYKTQEPTVRHIGPTAQDFKAAFNLGESDTGISTVDANGVALAAIQGLYEMLREKDTELKELRKELKALKHQLASSE